MAVISDEYGYLFIMSPRTGCTATSIKLIQGLGGRWLPPEDVTDDEGRVLVERKHSTLPDLVNNGVIDAQRATRLFTFSAVRNPFDSLVSLHTKLTRQYLPLLDDPDAFIHRKPAMLADMRFLAEHTFSEWIVEKYGDLPPDPNRHLYGSFLKGMDRILRFERLQADFDEVMTKLGVPGDTTIPRFNETVGRPPDYRSMYTDDARRVVERAFEADLVRFGYRF